MNVQTVEANRPIRAWMYAGPYEKDVSDRYESNYAVIVEPYAPLMEEAERAVGLGDGRLQEKRIGAPVEEPDGFPPEGRRGAPQDAKGAWPPAQAARSDMQGVSDTQGIPHAAQSARPYAQSCRPSEGQPLTLFGQTNRWAYKRTDPSEAKMTWARFGEYARFLVTYAYNRIRVDRPGTYRFRIWLAGSSVVAINGTEAFRRRAVGRVEGEFYFQAKLAQGWNDCLIVLSNVHLHCTNSFLLAIEDAGCEIHLPLSLDGAARDVLEADFRKFHMRQYVLHRGDRVTLHLDEPLAQPGLWAIALYPSVRGEKTANRPVRDFRLKPARDATEIGLCACEELPGPGEYAIHIDYEDESGVRVEGVRLTFRHISLVEVPDEPDYSRRKQALLNLYASSPSLERSGRTGAFQTHVKLIAEGEQAPDIPAVEETIRYIDARYDCADFAMHGLLRLYFRYRDSKALPGELKEAMKRCILGFKYWEDEPGKSMMFTRSENHEILFFSAEYLAGLLFPTETFRNSGQNGLFHIQKGKSMAERWIKEKGTYGFMEWHSNTYYEEDLLALVNLYDFAETNSYIRILARQLIDLIVLLIATHSFKGVMGTTHGRCYEDTVIHPELEPMSHLNWLLLGEPRLLRDDRLSIGAVALLDSDYAPDPAWASIAKSEEELYTLTRMGLFPHEGLGGVNCATYRTADYMVSGLVESHKGRHGHQVQAGQVLLGGNVPVFVTCFDNKSETTRPSYWGGQYRMPKTIACKNVLAYVYRIDEAAGYTHCYFPIPQFDETRRAGKWIFGRKADAYVAVYSLKPYERTETGKYKDRELICFAKRNIWLIEAGSKAQYGSFPTFVQAISEARLIESGEDIDYTSPAVGTLCLGWDRICTVEGEPLADRGFPLISNRYAESSYGSGMIVMRPDGRQRILNFHI